MGTNLGCFFPVCGAGSWASLHSLQWGSVTAIMGVLIILKWVYHGLSWFIWKWAENSICWFIIISPLKVTIFRDWSKSCWRWCDIIWYNSCHLRYPPETGHVFESSDIPQKSPGRYTSWRSSVTQTYIQSSIQTHLWVTWSWLGHDLVMTWSWLGHEVCCFSLLLQYQIQLLDIPFWPLGGLASFFERHCPCEVPKRLQYVIGC